MKKIIYLASLLGLFLLASCKKSGTDDDDGGNQQTNKRLTKITQTGTGTVLWNLTYDNSGRLLTVNSGDNVFRTTFHYDAAGNPVKVDHYDDQNHSIFEYSYNNNVPVSGSFKSWSLSSGDLTDHYAMQYTVANGQVSSIGWADILYGGSTVSVMTYENGNLVKVQHQGSVNTFTYGNKKPVYPKVFKYVMDPAIFSWQYHASNEIISIHYDLPDPAADFNWTNQYTYDSDGYVATSTNGMESATYHYE